MSHAHNAEKAAKEFVDSLPVWLQLLREEIQKRLTEFLLKWCQKMDLVTREEFDIQLKVLLHTRLKLEALENKLAALEKKT